MESFNFTWDKNQIVSGKVLSKQIKSIDQRVKTRTNTSETVKNITRNKLDTDDTVNIPVLGKSKSNSGLVKRKQKKDKLTSDATIGMVNSHHNGPVSTFSLYSERNKPLHINLDLKGKSLVEKVFSEDKQFSNLAIHEYIVSNLKKLGFVKLTNVQEKSIPLALNGKNLLIRSQTGSGKTLAYAVPIVHKLKILPTKLKRGDGLQAIILVPTRELALQTYTIFKNINSFQWIVVSYLCGGENRKTEKDRLRKGVHILIATPGRLLDHVLHTTACKLDNVKFLILDEADRLLDMGFKKDIVKIVEGLDSAKKNSWYKPLDLLSPSRSESSEYANTDRQTLLLSATLTKALGELADFTMKDHVYVDSLIENENSITKNPNHMVIPQSVRQEFIITFVKHRLFTLASLLISKGKCKSKIFVFMATTQMVEFHYELFSRCLLEIPTANNKKLVQSGITLLDNYNSDLSTEMALLDLKFFKLHGNMDQQLRKQVVSEFKAKGGILICTDVAARGLDVPGADYIIQYTSPQSDDDYLHRVGRTGRAGKSGHSLIFLTHHEQDFISRLQNFKIFLKEQNSNEYLKNLCNIMHEPNQEQATRLLQDHFESTINKHNDLYKLACFAYSSWSRFYNSYSSELRKIFDFKKINLGHYVTSFGLKDTPTTISKVVKGHVEKIIPKRLNSKLQCHQNDNNKKVQKPIKRKLKSISLSTSEYSSGLEPARRKKKKI